MRKVGMQEVSAQSMTGGEKTREREKGLTELNTDFASVLLRFFFAYHHPAPSRFTSGVRDTRRVSNRHSDSSRPCRSQREFHAKEG